VVPLVERVVKTHSDAAFADGSREIAKKVAVRTNFNGVPRVAPRAACFRTGPERKPFVVLRRRDDISCARACKYVGPFIGIEELGPKERGEVCIWRVRAIDAAMELPGCRTFIRRRSEEHTSELQSLAYLVCRLLLEKK